jgi:hypothetical protein
MPTTGTATEADGDKRRAFINHQWWRTSNEPYNIENHFNTNNKFPGLDMETRGWANPFDFL